ncbi:MAG: hypothetical protein K2L05_08035 [Muribaculaceae bacterium]|nr:hypothetical protein [Muribaculaceae bacterium]
MEIDEYVAKNKETFKEVTLADLPFKIIGWVDKQKQFADGSPIEIHEMMNNVCGLMLKGKVSRIGNSTYVDGTFYQKLNPDKSYHFGNNVWYTSTEDSIIGRFLIKNTVDGKFIADKKSKKIKKEVAPFYNIKEIVPLSVDVINIERYHGKVEYRLPLHAIKQNDGKIYVAIDITDISLPLGRERPKLVETTTDSLNLILTIDKELRLPDANWLIALRSDVNWHVVFENGDEYFGPIKPNENDNYKGKYKFSNGDTVIGEFVYPVFWGSYSIPDWRYWDSYSNCKVVFADGTTIDPKTWLKSIRAYELLSRNAIKSITGKTPTELRDNTIAAVHKRQQEIEQEELQKRKQAERERQQAERERKQEQDIEYLSQHAKSLEYFIKLSNNEVLIEKYKDKTFYIKGEIQRISPLLGKNKYFINFKSPDLDCVIKGTSTDENFSELIVPAKVIVKATLESAGQGMFGKGIDFTDVKILAIIQ